MRKKVARKVGPVGGETGVPRSLAVDWIITKSNYTMNSYDVNIIYRGMKK